MEGLEDDADVTPSEACERVLVQRAERVADHRGLAEGRPLETTDDHQQRGLARSRRADYAHRFAGFEIEIDPPEDLDRSRARAQGDAEISERYDGWTGGGH